MYLTDYGNERYTFSLFKSQNLVAPHKHKNNLYSRKFTGKYEQLVARNVDMRTVDEVGKMMECSNKYDMLFCLL